jgi:hypothetical protein
MIIVIYRCAQNLCFRRRRFASIPIAENLSGCLLQEESAPDICRLLIEHGASLAARNVYNARPYVCRPSTVNSASKRIFWATKVKEKKALAFAQCAIEESTAGRGDCGYARGTQKGDACGWRAAGLGDPDLAAPGRANGQGHANQEQ